MIAVFALLRSFSLSISLVKPGPPKYDTISAATPDT